MTRKKVLIVEKLDPPMKQEGEWKEWYMNEHISRRLNIPGFLSGRYLMKIEGIPKGIEVKAEAKYLALYDLTDTSVLRRKPYLKLLENEALRPLDSFEVVTTKLPRFACGIYKQVYPEQGDYEPPDAKFVLAFGHEVPRGKRDEYFAWYNTEAHPKVSRVPGIVTIRRFVLAGKEFPPLLGSEGSLPKYLTVYDIESPNVLESEEFKRATQSPWGTWVRSWFTRKMSSVYHRIYPKY